MGPIDNIGMLNDSQNQPNTWLHPDTAAFDFRGDVRTRPTAAMLQALSHASLEDDVSGTDSTTNDLQDYIAHLAGKPAGLFVLSGTMGNIVSLRSLLSQPPYAILCDSRAHILNNESGGAFAFTGATPQAVQPANRRYLTLEDILPHIKIDDGKQIHATATRVISLENTLNGMVMPLAETQRICQYAREHGILVHLDGARLWEAVASGEAGSLSDYGTLFDTITLCFAKGLGAPAGAVIVGNKDIIRRARWIRQSIGGGIRQPGPLCAAARVAVEKTFCGSLLRRTHEVARDIATFWQSRGGKLKFPTETNMVWLEFEGLPFSLQDLVDEAGKRGVLVTRSRLVVHYQICEQAVGNLKEALGVLFLRSHTIV